MTAPPICLTGAEAPPSFLGISGGNYNSVVKSVKKGVSCCAGTFGALVQGPSGSNFVLSTNHVLARNSNASSGPGSASVNELIVQPGLMDLACWQDPTDQVAELKRWVPLNFSGSENTLDAAIAKIVQADQGPTGPLVPGVDPEGRILNINGFAAPGKISTTPFPFNDLIDGLEVMKMGRTSCLTIGAIDAFDAMGKVIYPQACNSVASGTALFDHQILVLGEVPGQPGVCSFATTGDSGSIVLTADFTCPQAIGMVFAGASGADADSGGSIVAVNPIGRILKTFNVSLVGQECTGSSLQREVEGTTQPAAIGDALRASIEHVRSVKEIHGPKLLALPGVAAVGIGAGDTPASASLKVYLTKDTPEIRNAITSEVGGEKVSFGHLSSDFNAL